MPIPPAVVLASRSCSFHESGTLRLNAIMRLSASIFRSIASFASPVERLGLLPQRRQQAAAVLGQDRDRIGAEQLVVADGGRDRARPGRRHARLHVIGAVAAGLEGVDADNLIARQAGGGRSLGIGALEVELAWRALRHEAVLLGGGFQEIGDQRDRRLFARLRSGRGWIDRPRRPRIERRLGEHVVGELDRRYGRGAWHCARAASRSRRSNRRRLPRRRLGGPEDIARAWPDSRQAPALGGALCARAGGAASARPAAKASKAMRRDMALHVRLLSAIFLDSAMSQKNAPQMRRAKGGSE